MTERQRTVALLIDYDNLQICYSRDAPGTQLDLGAVVALAQSYGRVVIARAYAEWNLLSERLAVYKAGLEPAFAPVLRPEGSNREGKSLADTVMVSDGVDLLWTHQPDVLVLVTSDKDMLPLARIAKQRGCLVVVLGSDLTAVQLIEMANEFITYRHLIKELGRPEEKLATARIREEPRLRRARETVGSPEVAAARDASLRQPRTPPGRVRTRTGPALPSPGAALAPEPVAVPAEAREPSGAEATLSLLDEHGQPIVTRRRRRRRRRGSAGEAERPPEETLAAAAASGGQQDETGEDRVDLELDRSGALVVREQPRPEPLVEPPASAADATLPSDSGDHVESDGAAVEDAAEPEARREPASLRPWERWPDPPPAATPPIRGVRGRRSRPSPVAPTAPVAEQPGPAAETSPDPVAVAPDPTGGAAVDRASLPVEAVQADVAAEWSPSAAAAGVSADPAEQPASPRRPRRRRPSTPKAAVAAGADAGEAE